MQKTEGEKRRVRRLAAAGVLCFVVLVFVLSAVARLGLKPQESVSGQPLPMRNVDVDSGVDPRLGHAVAGIAGFDVEVWCWSSEDWKKRTAQLARRYRMERLGPWRAYTFGNPPAIHLSPQVCAELEDLATRNEPLGGDSSNRALAWSLGTLAHEAYHASGRPDEALALCFGMQSMEKIARRLGRTIVEGRQLAKLYWEYWYLRFGREYRSDECRNGGNLDLQPETAVWP